jgi:RNA polymerase primary sigma factor
MTIDEKIKPLSSLADKQGYITYADINDAFPGTLHSCEELEEIYIKLRNLEIEILDQKPERDDD